MVQTESQVQTLVVYSFAKSHVVNDAATLVSARNSKPRDGQLHTSKLWIQREIWLSSYRSQVSRSLLFRSTGGGIDKVLPPLVAVGKGLSITAYALAILGLLPFVLTEPG